MLPTKLKLESLGHCYAQLPEAFVTKELGSIKPGAIVSIRSIQNETEIFVVWNAQLSPDQCVQLDLGFGQANKFHHEELIVLSLVQKLEPTECSLCRVELLDSADYSILSQHLDANVLDICRLVTRGLVIPIPLSQHVKVLVKVVDIRPNVNVGLLTKWTEMQFQHNLDEVPKPEKLPEIDIPILKPIPFVSYSLGIDYKTKFVLGPLLVCGERGSGKTHFLKTTIYNYRKFHGQLFDCSQLRGKRPENVTKKFNELLNNALENQPSLLCLDDLDSFVPNNSGKHEEDKGTEAIYKNRLVDALCCLFKQLERSEHKKGQRVCIIVTCRSLKSLDERISNPKGRQYFNELIQIENPNLKDRMDIIKSIIAEHKQIKCGLNEDQLEEVAEKCGSFMPMDLRRVVERGIINASSRSLLEFSSDLLSIQMEDLIISLHGYTPSNLRGIALQPKTTRTFDDVGGMKEIKEAVMKTILLQIKYPKLFKKCPMRPQTSILLYGPPGCGKTLLAEALTNEESINSICVRGPELLSKYIGASESAVRNLFKRAELARPCVIFFDEFESLVSKRGADSTGVTDRVVNQFLTLMDGVEKLSDNIFIIAASSRPDMIDPAILRPGRLDKHIYCPVPNREDRIDILKVLSKNLEVEDLNSTISDWSERLEGFTGADIQSFLYSAQLKAVHDIVGPSDLTDTKQGNYKREKSSDFDIIVKQSHLVESFNEMKADVVARHKKLLTQYPATIRNVTQQVATRATLA